MLCGCDQSLSGCCLYDVLVLFSWARWRWTVRSSRSVRRFIARCSPRRWRLPWTVWKPWTRCPCQDASVCEATVMWGRLTRAALEKRKEKEEDHCCCCHPHHHAHQPPLSGPSRAAQVGMDFTELPYRGSLVGRKCSSFTAAMIYLF